MAVSFRLLRGETARTLESDKGLEGLLAKGWTLRGLAASGADATPDRLSALLRAHDRVLELSIEDCAAIRDLSVLDGFPVIALTIRQCARLDDVSMLAKLPKLRELSIFGGSTPVPELPELEILTVGH